MLCTLEAFCLSFGNPWPWLSILAWCPAPVASNPRAGTVPGAPVCGCGDPNIPELSQSPPALKAAELPGVYPAGSSPGAPRCSNLSSGGGRAESSGKALGKRTGIPSAAGLSSWRTCPRECRLLESSGRWRDGTSFSGNVPQPRRKHPCRSRAAVPHLGNGPQGRTAAPRMWFLPAAASGGWFVGKAGTAQWDELLEWLLPGAGASCLS